MSVPVFGSFCYLLPASEDAKQSMGSEQIIINYRTTVFRLPVNWSGAISELSNPTIDGSDLLRLWGFLRAQGVREKLDINDNILWGLTFRIL